MTVQEIIREIQLKVERNQRVHYNYPDCQRLVNKQTEALTTAVKALELSEKYVTKAAERWAAQEYGTNTTE